MNQEEIMALAAERLGEKLIGFYEAEAATLSGVDENLRPAIFAMAAIGVGMSLLVAAGSAPDEAFRRLVVTAAGVAEDLA